MLRSETYTDDNNTEVTKQWCEEGDDFADMMIECKEGQSGNCICPLDLWNWVVNDTDCCWYGRDANTDACNDCRSDLMLSTGECCAFGADPTNPDIC